MTTASIHAFDASPVLIEAAKVTWKIMRIYSQYFFTRSPSVVYGENWVRNNTGSVSLDDYIAEADIKLSKSNIMLEAWGQTDPLHVLTDAVEIRLNYPNGHAAIYKNASHNQRIDYKPSTFGTYVLQFSDVDGLKWDCYYTLYDFDITGSRSVAYNSVGDSLGDVFRSENGNNYIYPSVAHDISSMSSKSYMTLNDVRLQMFDDELGTYVYDFKDYQIGDDILVKESITGLSYDATSDSTILTFAYDDSELSWPFKGNITEKYNIGDQITFKFKVVEETDDNSFFETLDILKEYQNDRYPNIMDYLVE